MQTRHEAVASAFSWVKAAVQLAAVSSLLFYTEGDGADVGGLCVFIFDPSDFPAAPAVFTRAGAPRRWIEAAQTTWANQLTFFVSSAERILPSGERLPVGVHSFAKHGTNQSESQHRLVLDFSEDKTVSYIASKNKEDDRPPTWKRGLQFWAMLSALLGRENKTDKASTGLEKCQWLLHIDHTAYVNLDRLIARLACLDTIRPEYYTFSPLMNDAHVTAADEGGGYLFSRRLLALLDAPSWRMKCEKELDLMGADWNMRPGFYVSLCLWLIFRLQPQRLGDPVQEVLVPMDQGSTYTLAYEGGYYSTLRQLRDLIPTGHCVIVVVCDTPQSMHAVHRIVADDFNSRHVGCPVNSLVEPLSLAPAWLPRTASALLYCPIRLAIRREVAAGASPLSLGKLFAEFKHPSRPMGLAADRLRAAARIGRRWELCVLLPATAATEKQIMRARAVAATWAREFLQADPSKSSVLALLYSQRPLFPAWESWTLSLVGDLDLRHAKFNSLRFIYLWYVLAEHHAEDCDFFMKADMDAYVDVPRLKQALLQFNASEPIYTGKLTTAFGPAFESWDSFAHGLGYVLSRGALQHIRTTLGICLEVLKGDRIESIEDMFLASCLRKAKVTPQNLGPVVFDFSHGMPIADAVSRNGSRPLITHPVDPEDMFRIHDALRHDRWT